MYSAPAVGPKHPTRNGERTASKPKLDVLPSGSWADPVKGANEVRDPDITFDRCSPDRQLARAPRPGIEPGTARSRRGMISISPSGYGTSHVQGRDTLDFPRFAQMLAAPLAARHNDYAKSRAQS